MKVWTALTAAVMLVASALAEIEEDEGVLVLTDDNFEEAVNSHETLLVEFYAPWCGHCKKLAPEFVQAAAALLEQDPPVRIAKMDATEHKESPGKFGVQGYPTLKFFKGSTDAVRDYDGPRNAEGIQKWIQKKSGPAVAVIESEADLEKLQEDNKVVVVAVVDDVDGDQKAILEKVADSEDIAVIVATTSTSLHADASSVGSVVLLKQFDEGKVVYDGEFEKDAISEFIKANNMPLVIPYSSENSKYIFADVDAHFLFFGDDSQDYYSEYAAAIQQSAEGLRGELMHVTVPKSEKNILEYFDLSEDDLPYGMLVHTQAGMKKYPFPVNGADWVGNFDGEALLAHGKGFRDGSLKPKLKSAEPVDDSDEAVKVLSGQEFQERVVDNDKDVLVEFYAPWCGHCKTLAPKYEELAENFADVDSIMIAKMDATENEIDVPGVTVQGFPTVVFFPANDKANPKTYEGEREVEAFTEYLKENARKFELDGESHGVSHDEL